jgi:Thiol:disulfide interchange protein
MTSLPRRAPRLLAIALLAVLPTAACSRPESPAGTTSASGGGIAFSSGGFDAALARAQAEKRLLLVDVYTDWCGWCKKLDREVFADGRVGAAAKDLVAVKVNAEKGGRRSPAATASAATRRSSSSTAPEASSSGSTATSTRTRW